jgi:hypothetical protein
MAFFGLFGKKKSDRPPLSREQSLSARPVVNSLVKVEKDEEDNAVLQIPRRDTAMSRLVARVFKLSPYRQLTLDELGTFVIELCDGRHTVREIVDKFRKRFKLNQREAELSMRKFLRTLAEKSIIGLVVEEKGA